ncbi:SipW-cognate class signal peptide [Paenibacillus sp. yr247]|uniref:TasA family protein n=1 Tax=Paenibacillus sp. yr247 TaxID=1761880 RepID=UPI00088E2101|nr:TasA family protein [Paenibacillus sp. yr247]SDO66318.1 SipW-cognate class signal peptide [Paenibacillus sp. yr247]
MATGLKKQLVLAMAITALGATLVAGGTSALFTASASNTNNSFTAGTVKIALDKADTVAKYFNVSNIAPGDSGSSPVVVTNTGSLELRYDITSTVTGGLAVAQPGDNHPLTVKIYSDAAMTQEIVAGDNNRVLAPNVGTETLYVKWQLPLDAGNAYQGLTATYSIEVAAEQTKNN